MGCESPKLPYMVYTMWVMLIAILIQMETTVSLENDKRQPSNYDLKIEHAGFEIEGLLQMFFNGTWMTVRLPDPHLSAYNTSARVACGQMGLEFALPTLRNIQGSFPELFVSQCAGYELRLIDCLVSNVRKRSYFKSGKMIKVPPIKCVEKNLYKNYDVKLINSGDKKSGTVLVFFNNLWWTICDDYWDDLAASVVCRQLGFSGKSIATDSLTFAPGNRDILMDNIMCNGTEKNLGRCHHPGIRKHNCHIQEHAGVKCEVVEEENHAFSSFEFQPDDVGTFVSVFMLSLLTIVVCCCCGVLLKKFNALGHSGERVPNDETVQSGERVRRESQHRLPQTCTHCHYDGRYYNLVNELWYNWSRYHPNTYGGRQRHGDMPPGYHTSQFRDAPPSYAEVTEHPDDYLLPEEELTEPPPPYKDEIETTNTESSL